jgi:protein TonB
MFRFLMENIRYPQKARADKIEGRVIISFTVKTDGSVADVETMKGIGGGCDEEAIRVVKLMPKWKSGEDQGKRINVAMVLPVKFSLDTAIVKK